MSSVVKQKYKVVRYKLGVKIHESNIQLNHIVILYHLESIVKSHESIVKMHEVMKFKVIIQMPFKLPHHGDTSSQRKTSSRLVDGDDLDVLTQ